MDFTRYETQNNLRIDYLKFKLWICRKREVLLSSFDRNVVCDIAVSLHISSYIHVPVGYKLSVITVYPQARN